MIRRTPYSGGKATRSTPERRSAPRAALSASSIASRASRALTKQGVAGVGGGNLPGGADKELDAKAALERRK